MTEPDGRAEQGGGWKPSFLDKAPEQKHNANSIGKLVTPRERRADASGLRAPPSQKLRRYPPTRKWKDPGKAQL